jgi:hypothetical protein
MFNQDIKKTLLGVADFYDRRKVGNVGSLGFRRSSDLKKLISCVETMTTWGILVPHQSFFLDLGCADGRVNVLLSYLVNMSVGVEIDEWTWDEYPALRKDLEDFLRSLSLPPPPDNIHLFHGDSTDPRIHKAIKRRIGADLKDFDLFYTYLVMYEEFSELIAGKAKRGAVFMVYGMERILPRLDGMQLITPEPLEGILALYQKI